MFHGQLDRFGQFHLFVHRLFVPYPYIPIILIVAFPRMTPPVAMPRTTSVPVGVSPYESINDVKENSGYFNQYLHASLPPQPQQHQLLPIQHFQMAYQQLANVNPILLAFQCT